MNLTIFAWYVGGWWKLIDTQTTSLSSSTPYKANYSYFYQRLKNKNQGLGSSVVSNSLTSYYTFDFQNGQKNYAAVNNEETESTFCCNYIFEYNDNYYISTTRIRNQSFNANIKYKETKLEIFEKSSFINAGSLSSLGATGYDEDSSYNSVPTTNSSCIQILYSDNTYYYTLHISNNDLFLNQNQKNNTLRSVSINASNIDFTFVGGYQVLTKGLEPVIIFACWKTREIRIVKGTVGDNKLGFGEPVSLNYDTSKIKYTRFLDLQVQKVNDYQNNPCTVILLSGYSVQGRLVFFDFPNGIYDSNYNWKSFEIDNETKYNSILNKNIRMFYINKSFTQLIGFSTTSSDIAKYRWQNIYYFRKTFQGIWIEVTDSQTIYGEHPELKSILSNFSNGLPNVVFSNDPNSGFYTYSYQDGIIFKTYDLVWND